MARFHAARQTAFLGTYIRFMMLAESTLAPNKDKILSNRFQSFRARQAKWTGKTEWLERAKFLAAANAKRHAKPWYIYSNLAPDFVNNLSEFFKSSGFSAEVSVTLETANAFKEVSNQAPWWHQFNPNRKPRAPNKSILKCYSDARSQHHMIVCTPSVQATMPPRHQNNELCFHLQCSFL